MTAPTPTELDHAGRLRRKADSLSNGHRGDIDTMSDVLVEVAHGIATIIETGYVVPAECNAAHEALRDDIRRIVADGVAAPATEPEIPPKMGARIYRMFQRAPWPVCALIGWLAWLAVTRPGAVVDVAAKVAGAGQ